MLKMQILVDRQIHRQVAVDLAVEVAFFYRKRIKYNDLRTAKSHPQFGGGLGGGPPMERGFLRPGPR